VLPSPGPALCPAYSPFVFISPMAATIPDAEGEAQLLMQALMSRFT
jgi:hypothetical protein